MTIKDAGKRSSVSGTGMHLPPPQGPEQLWGPPKLYPAGTGTKTCKLYTAHKMFQAPSHIGHHFKRMYSDKRRILERSKYFSVSNAIVIVS
jgi:hypothetical protein